MNDQERTHRGLLLTIGYEGKTVDSFLALLAESGVAVLVDVREFPLSRKPGFSKTRLREALARRGIEYVPMRALGSPRDLREELREDGDYRSFFARYQEHLSQQRGPLGTLARLLADKAV